MASASKPRGLSQSEADAFLASRLVMKRALSQIAFWDGQGAMKIARDALQEAHDVLEAGLRSSAPR